MAKRKHSKEHPGVSIGETGNGRWRIRWREREADGSRIMRTWRIHGTAADAKRAAIEVYEAVQTHGIFQAPEESGRPTQPDRPAVADLRRVLVAWATWRKTHKGDRARTIEMRRVWTTKLVNYIREVHGLEPTGHIPATLCSTETAGRVAALIDKPHTRAKVLGVLWQAWTWASDEPERWPGLAPAPRDRSRVVPDLPPPSRPLEPPTWDEVLLILDEAVLLPQSQALWVLTLAAYTGLRVGQVLGLRFEDFDLSASTLEVRGDLGKSRKERSGRVVPLAPALVPLVKHLEAARGGASALFDHEPESATYEKVLYAAEKRGLRAAVWRSEGRRNRRRTHWARAAFQAELRRQGVADSVIDALVGHAGKTVRDRHYAPASWEAQVEAVGKLPGLPDGLVPQTGASRERAWQRSPHEKRKETDAAGR